MTSVRSPHTLNVVLDVFIAKLYAVRSMIQCALDQFIPPYCTRPRSTTSPRVINCPTAGGPARYFTVPTVGHAGRGEWGSSSGDPRTAEPLPAPPEARQKVMFATLP